MAYGALGVYRWLSLSAVYEIIPQAQEEPISVEPCFYAVIGGYKYAAGFGRSMYRINLQTHYRELYLQMPIFGVITDGEKLFFLTASDGTPGLLSYRPATGDMQAITNFIDAAAGIRYQSGMIFYVDHTRRIRSVLTCGRPVATHRPTNVAAFDVRLPYLIFTQHDCDIEKEYNMNTGEINFP